MLNKELEYLLYPDVKELKRRISQVSTGPNSPLNATSSAYSYKDKQSLSKRQNNAEEISLYSLKSSAPMFYSNAANAVQGIRQEKATPEQWLKMIEKAGDGTYWNINTAGIFKTSYGKKRKEVYNRHTTAKQSAETDEALRNAEPSGTQANPSMITSTLDSSDSKYSTSESKIKRLRRKMLQRLQSSR